MILVTLFSFIIIPLVIHCSHVHHDSTLLALNCSTCGWTNANENRNTPSAAIIYLHNRRCGGSQYLKVLKDWMAHYQCDSINDPGRDGTQGVREGNLLPLEQGAIMKNRCPSLDVNYDDEGCFDSNLIEKFPMQHHRSSVPFTFFTMLRHPLERIGSQAFSGSQIGQYAITTAILNNCHHLFRDHAHIDIYEKAKSCYASNSRDPMCTCVTNSAHQGFEHMQVNTSLWMDWITRGGGYGDEYKKNYYIERLIGGHVQAESPARVSALSCLQIPKSCVHRMTNIYSDTTVTTESSDENVDRNKLFNSIDKKGDVVLNVMAGLDPTSICSSDKVRDHSSHKHNRHRSNLSKAKAILKDHFKFILLEDMGSRKAAAIYASAFNEKDTGLVHNLMKSHVNPGLVTIRHRSSTSYISYMPPEIAEFLMSDNAEDILFYEYAKSLYHKIKV